MGSKRVLLPSIFLALWGLSLATYFGPQSAAQPLQGQPPAIPLAVGRYQMLKTGTGSEFVVMDTTTGHCWERVVVYPGTAAVNGRSEWRDLGPPPPEKPGK